MATIEKLFNFDDQLLGRQLAGQKDDFQMGQELVYPSESHLY